MGGKGYDAVLGLEILMLKGEEGYDTPIKWTERQRASKRNLFKT